MRQFSIPTVKDPRWPVFVFLFGYSILAVNKSFTYTQTPVQLAAIVATCLVLDLFLEYLFHRQVRFPLSGFITALAAFVLVDTLEIWAYATVGALAILSKHLITAEKRHIFNPSIFGLTVSLLFLPDYVVSNPASRWGASTQFFLFFLISGLFIVYRAKRLALSLSYVVTFYVGTFVQSLVLGESFLVVAAPMTGAAYQYHAFYMISDPATTPSKPINQIGFGVLLGILDKSLRCFELKQSAIYSLFILCALYALIREKRVS